MPVSPPPDRSGDDTPRTEYPQPSAAHSPASLAALLGEDLRLRWRKGERPRAEDYLRDYPRLAEYPDALLDLICREYALRQELGEAPAAQEYLARFPGHARALGLRLASASATAVAPDRSGTTAASATAGSTAAALPPVADPPGPAGVPGYEVLEELGRGGMGVVYLARQTALKRLVALKMIRNAEYAGEQERDRFRAEAESVARLQHPHVVQIYEVGEHRGRPYLALEFVDGGSLDRRLAGTPLPLREAARLAVVVARAVHAAHRKGVVHRDLKPANVLLARDGTAKVTDFGLAKRLDDPAARTQTGAWLGTPSYMAPEQAADAREVGPAADVWALGALLYEMLTGRPPFKAATPLDTLKHVVERDPVSPRQLNPAVDRDVETICLKCLEKSPQRRYASAAALAEDLQRFLEHRPIVARPVRALEKATRWCRRNPFIAGSVAAVVAVFLAAFALVSWSYWRTEAALREEARQRAAANEARDDARRHERAERWERYRAAMTAAASAFQSQNVSVARHAIEAAPAEHRNWEWRHFRQWLDQSRQTLGGQGEVGQVRFVGNDRLVTFDGRLLVWDVSTGRVVRTLDDYLPGAWTVLDSDPRRLLAYQARENTIILWDVAADHRLAVLRGYEGPLGCLHFDPDGTRLVACTHQHQAHVWDTASGQSVRTWSFREGMRGRLGFDLGDHRLLVSNFPDGSSRLWDTQTARRRAVLAGHQAPVICAAFNQQGTRIVTSEAYPGNVLRLWDAQTGTQVASLRGHGNEAHHVQFSPDGKWLASCSFDQTVRLWDGMTGAPVATLAGHSGRVMAVAFSPDCRRLVSASQDHTLRLWDTTSGALIAVLCGHTADVVTVVYSPDGSLIASGSADLSARLWDARLAERNGILRGHTSFVYGAAFHPDGERVASASWDGTVRLWDATSGQETAVLRYPQPTFINSVAVDASGALLATVGRDNAVRLWDLGRQREVHHWTLPTEHWQDSRVRFSPGGDLLAAGDMNGTVHVWDVRSRETRAVLRGHRDTVHDVAFSPDTRWLASCGADGDRSIRIWDVGRKEQAHVLEGHTAGVGAVAFSPGGDLLVSGSRDGTARLWDTKTWEQVAVLNHGTIVHDVAFTPDGTRLATGCADNSIRLWDVPTRQEVAELRGHGSYVKALAFSPDGTRLASASGDCTVRVWDTLSAWERQRGGKPADER
jgi:WD40 repeat protein/tRNA A-37 threonylcarbamoyl transferase component Bud32